MKVSTEIDNNFGYEKITQLVDNIPLSHSNKGIKHSEDYDVAEKLLSWH
jgi:hypothetical protein